MTGSAWHGTLPKSDSVGKSINGFTITASGIDENGNEVEGYILGKGDVGILNTDGTITVGETTYYLHFLPNKPETPHLADVIFEDEQWKIWNGTEWTHFGGGDYLPIVGGTLDSGTEFPTNLNVGQNSIGVITVKGTNVNQTLLGNET